MARLTRRAAIGSAALALAPLPALTSAGATEADPAVIAWNDCQRVYRDFLNISEEGDEELDAACDVTWKAYEAAWRRLVTTTPTTVRGLQAKVAAARSDLEDPAWVAAMLDSVLAVEPDKLGRS